MAASLFYLFSTKICFQQLTPGGMTQPADCFFLDLPDPFTGQPELFTDLFKCHFLATYSEEKADNVAFPFGKGGQRTADLLGQ